MTCGHPTAKPGCTQCAYKIIEAIRAAETALKKHLASKPQRVVEVKLK